jgi:phosphoribosylformylglycinamidine synthase
VCDRIQLRVERTNLAWTQAYQQDEVITLPIAHGEGCYYANADTLAMLEDNQQILFRYCAPNGELGDLANPNGSSHHIAGICNRDGNILGMMPHPERAADALLGSTDGLRIFDGILQRVIVGV